MATWTLFADDSGSLDRAASLGVRLLGGPLLAGTPDDAEERCRRLLRGALDATGAEWWTGEIHAHHFLHEDSFARRCREHGALKKVQDPPWHGLWNDAGAFLESRRPLLAGTRRSIQSGGIKLLTALREAVGKEVKRAIAVGEWGHPSALPARSIPRVLRDAPTDERMLAALLEWTAVRVAEEMPQENHVLHAVIATRRTETILVTETTRQVIARLARTGIAIQLDQREPRFARAARSKGLQIADVIVHAMRCGMDVHEEPDADTVCRRTSAHVDRFAVRDLQLPSGAWREHDAHRPWVAMRQLLSDFPVLEHATARLAATRLAPLPASMKRNGELYGLFPIAIETVEQAFAALAQRAAS